MPFEPNNQDLSKLISQGFNTDDIPQRADQAGFSKPRLTSILTKKSDEIWRAGSDELTKLHNLEKEYEDTTTKKVREVLRIRRAILSTARWFLRALIPSLLVLLLPIFITVAFTSGLGAALTTFLASPRWIILVVAAIILLIVFLFYRSQSEGISYIEYALRDKVQQDKDLTDLKKKVDEAQQNLDNKVITQGIKPLLKEIINARLNTAFSTTLPELEYSGLSEVFSSDNEVATDSKHKLEFLLNTMPGGSIGIAGPRGAGKTTLLKSSCKDALNATDNPKVISILTSSPVEYQARDFILHLFSSVCFKTLEIATGRKSVHTTWEEVEEIRQPVITSFSQFLPAITRTCFITGMALVILSFTIAGFTMKGNPPLASQQTTAAEPSPDAAGSNEQTAAKARAAEQDSPSAVGRFIGALEIKPGPLLMWGVILILVSFAIAFSVGRMEMRQWQWRRFLRKGNESYFDPPAIFRPGSEEFNRLEESYEEAKRWLKEIKFQQSYTSGWSGALKLPIGLEGGLNTAVNLAQQQLSLPDITKGFCDFLTLLSRDFRIIIGIDELDKLESDEAAQRFLNEIKAIFGLERIFYLISVSENAMSNFERRGLPFRDVFDSSFDDIIYVDYLNLDCAKRLIARRVIAMPPPFIHLGYCLSGGLARDLVRACRNLMELSQVKHHTENGQTPSPVNGLSKISGSLVKADLVLKIHAMSVAAKRIEKESDVTWFLDILHKIEAGLESTPSLLKHYSDLIASLEPTKREERARKHLQVQDFMELYERLKKSLSSDNQRSVEDEVSQKPVSFHEEFATYIYYCATLLQFFDDSLDAIKVGKVENDKALDKLTRARQSLSVNPKVTRLMIDEFRRSLSMDVPSLINTHPAEL